MGQLIKLFGQRSFHDIANSRFAAIHGKVMSEDRNYLLNADESQYLEYLVSQFRIEPLVLRTDLIEYDDCERFFSAREFPQNRHFPASSLSDRKYPVQVLTFYVPVEGDHELLTCQPSTYIHVGYADFGFDGRHLTFGIIDWYKEPGRISSFQNEIVCGLNQQCGYLHTDVDGFNARLHARAGEILAARRKELLDQANVRAVINVPMRRAHAPGPIAAPLARKRIVVDKPQASAARFIPEPSLDNSTYEEILQVLDQTGRMMESHPSVYADKDEEAKVAQFVKTPNRHFFS